MMSTSWERLTWDSEFFGFPVALIRADTGAGELAPVVAQLCEQGVVLAYWILERPDETRVHAAQEQAGRLVDQKTTFVAPIEAVLSATADATRKTTDYTGEPAVLRPLALAAGVSSRFRVDPSMPAHHFEQLYTIWLERSVRREIAKVVSVTGPADAPTGFVTIGVKNARVDIGLIAVDERARGQGCGKALVRRAAQWGLDSGMETLQVVTQGANTAACELYRRCGMTPETVSPVFHFWLRDVPLR